MRSTWNDYNSEFSRLEDSITRAVNRIEKGALAEHIKDSKKFMSEQRQRNVVEDIKSEEKSNLDSLFAPMLPPNEDMNYYIRDHETARRNLHPGTCKWILNHPKFKTWAKFPEENGGQLWINAGPGVEKTLLTSFIIDHFLNATTRDERPILLYFYFRESRLHNNNATAAMCSIAYQLHRQHEESRRGIEVNVKAIHGRAGNEGKSSFPEVWRLLSTFLARRINLVVILDALDECEDSNLLVPKLLDLATSERITLLMTSRRQKRLVRYLEQVETLEIAPEDVHHDIEAFVEQKVARNVRLSHHLVRDTVMKILLTQHEGMFLWVTLMLKELKACISVEEVQSTLMQVPSGLEGVYIKIVRRLGESLNRRAIGVTKNILTWVLGSARALTMNELREALCCQYQAQGHTLLSDGEFPYTDKDIENMCGSLISIRHGQIQTVHQSTKEHLIGLNEDRRLNQGLSILPTSLDTSLQLLSVCLTFQEKLCKSSFAKLQMSPFDNLPEAFDVQMLQDEQKPLNYSFFFWTHHVIDCPIQYRESVVAMILKHYSNLMTVFWIVVSLSVDPKGLWRLVIGVEEIEEWLLEDNPQENTSGAARQLQDWCLGTTKLLKAYSTQLLKNAWTIWKLDLKAFLGPEQCFTMPINCFNKSKESEESLQSSTSQANHLWKTPRNLTLDHNRWSLLKARLGFFVHDRNQNIFFSGEQSTSEEEECLFVQHAQSGKRLSPATAGLAAVLVDEDYHYGHVKTAKVSPQGKYLAVAYNKWLSIWAIEPDLKFSHRLRDRPWAFRLISEKYDREVSDCMTARTINFAGDEKLFTPRGWYDLHTREFHAFRSMLLEQTRAAHIICYSGDCSYLFTTQGDSSKEVSRQSVSAAGLGNPVITISNLDWTTIMTSSHTGKYLLLSRGRGEHVYHDYGPSRMTLFNIASMKMERFPRYEDFSSFGECSFHFSEEEDILVMFLWEPETRRGVNAMMTVSVWNLGFGQAKLCSQGQISTVVAAHPATIINPPIIAMTARDVAWIVSCDRKVQVVKFNPEEISFPGYDLKTDESSVLHSQVSPDGQRLGIVRVLESRIDLEIINLVPSLQKAFHVEKTIPNIERIQPICPSPNLDLLVLDRFALTINTENNELSPPIECDINPITPIRDWTWTCSISSCGDFVAFDKPAYKHHADFYDRQPGRLVVFRISRTEHTATRLTAPCLENLVPALFDFHPLLPLAAFSSSEGEGSDSNQGYGEPYACANEINLSMFHLSKDQAVPLEPVQMTQQVCSKLCFADTGDFLLLKGQDQKSRIIVSDLPYQSQPLCVIPDNQHVHPSKDRSYILNSHSNSIDISMNRFQNLAHGDALPAYQDLQSTSKVESLTVFPSTMGWPNVWLLLGDDYSKPLRVLLQPTNGEPLVMRTLTVSWDELRERLETTLTPV